MLMPAVLPPEVDVFDTSTRVRAQMTKGMRHFAISTYGSMFVGPPPHSVVVLPEHLMWATIKFIDGATGVETDCTVVLHEPTAPGAFARLVRNDDPPAKVRPHHGVYSELGAVYITGPGLLRFRLEGTVGADIPLDPIGEIAVRIVLPIAGSDRPIDIQYRSAGLKPIDASDLALWVGTKPA